jgi:hypothetical protein
MAAKVTDVGVAREPGLVGRPIRSVDGLQLLPDVRPKSSPDRNADLTAAKALVAEIQEEERRRGK